MAVPSPLTLVSLCDGYGGTELALRSVAPVSTVCRVERDPYAAAILVERMEQARLDSCPCWDDLVTFDGSAWRGRVDIVAAGFPCQPFSAAGHRAGVDDDRWLWPDIARIIRDMAPRYVLLENVGQLLAHGLPEVLYDLASFGFDAEWGLYRASAVGAPHRRERIWIVAHREGARRGERIDGALSGGLPADPQAEGNDVGYSPGYDSDGRRSVSQPAERHQDVGDASCGHVSTVVGTGHGGTDDHGAGGWSRPGEPEDVADATHSTEGHPGGQGTAHTGHSSSSRDLPRPELEDVADAQGVDEREPHQQERTVTRDNTRAHLGWGGFPPRPDDHDGWADWITEGGPQPVLRRLTDGPPTGLADALHLGGNGLVPQCAAEAWGQLIERAGLT